MGAVGLIKRVNSHKAPRQAQLRVSAPQTPTAPTDLRGDQHETAHRRSRTDRLTDPLGRHALLSSLREFREAQAWGKGGESQGQRR